MVQEWNRQELVHEKGSGWVQQTKQSRSVVEANTFESFDNIWMRELVKFIFRSCLELMPLIVSLNRCISFCVHVERTLRVDSIDPCVSLCILVKRTHCGGLCLTKTIVLVVYIRSPLIWKFSTLKSSDNCKFSLPFLASRNLCWFLLKFFLL